MVAPENLDLVVMVRIHAGQWFDAARLRAGLVPRLARDTFRPRGTLSMSKGSPLIYRVAAANYPEQATTTGRSASKDAG